ncbi:MAG: 50S ribosomal protein L6 [Gemmatimonadaceae bacterium]|jgi:large subunit ribosomal protein L6|nr:50S ribosomal protein L6 [Gemmatimonadaceae bacterium]MDQ3518256.1 50S ribosomal protein L6 [Gemmatimonadota bacterium]
MSRIGRKPVTLPKAVSVTLDGNTIRVKGPRGELTRSLHPAMIIAMEDGSLTVTRPSDENEHRALHGLTRSLIANMVEGVEKGFSRNLEIVGVGYKAETRPYGLQLALGYSHPIEYRAPKGVKLTATAPTAITIEGADKEAVGQVAAEIRRLRPPEPYKGKGIKYQGEQIRRKAGKAGGK